MKFVKFNQGDIRQAIGDLAQLISLKISGDFAASAPIDN